jgi:hypothetical protein
MSFYVLHSAGTPVPYHGKTGSRNLLRILDHALRVAEESGVPVEVRSPTGEPRRLVHPDGMVTVTDPADPRCGQTSPLYGMDVAA